MLRPGQGNHVHLVLGSPFREALGALSQSGPSRELWQWNGDLDRGDVILTAVDTTPRMFVAVETLAKSTGRSGYLEVDEVELLVPLVSVAAVRRRLGKAIPRIPGPVPDDFADALLDALEAERATPTPFVVTAGRRCESTTRLRSTGLQAQALALSRGLCQGCERNFGALLGGRGYEALQVHHLDCLGESPDEEVETTLDRVVTVCGACHLLLHARGRPTLQDVRYAWRPACPECTELQAQPILWGLPADPVPDDVVAAGCLVPARPPEWQCGNCAYQWRAEDEPNADDVGSDLRDVLRQHWPAPRGDASVYNFGSSRYLLFMSDRDEGYDAEYWRYDLPDGADLGGHEPVEKGSIIGPSSLRDMCAAVEEFIHRALAEEGESGAWP